MFQVPGDIRSLVMCRQMNFSSILHPGIFRRHQICTSSTNRLIVGCKRNESIAAIVEFKPFRFRFPRKGAESCEGTSFFFPTHTGIYSDFYKTLELESPSLLHMEFHEVFDSQKCQLIRRTQMCSPFFSQFYASKKTNTWNIRDSETKSARHTQEGKTAYSFAPMVVPQDRRVLESQEVSWDMFAVAIWRAQKMCWLA